MWHQLGRLFFNFKITLLLTLLLFSFDWGRFRRRIIPNKTKPCRISLHRQKVIFVPHKIKVKMYNMQRISNIKTNKIVNECRKDVRTIQNTNCVTIGENVSEKKPRNRERERKHKFQFLDLNEYPLSIIWCIGNLLKIAEPALGLFSSIYDARRRPSHGSASETG